MHPMAIGLSVDIRGRFRSTPTTSAFILAVVRRGAQNCVYAECHCRCSIFDPIGRTELLTSCLLPSAHTACHPSIPVTRRPVLSSYTRRPHDDRPDPRALPHRIQTR